jgi:zinc transport system ATP-binding protein
VTPPVVRLEQARFGYRGVVAARADLQVEPGEFVAVLGANGSGKSTLVKGMLGLVERYGGEVAWFGQPLGSLRERWRIGYVPQRQLAASPIPATIDELVRSGRVARAGLVGRPRAEDRRAVDAAIDAVALGEHRRRRVGELSGGQQRRALVARALAGDPDALVLDEPLAGVDRENQQALADTLATLAARGATLVVVLHELGALEPLVTRAVVMAAGEVGFDGPPAEAPAELDAAHHDHDTHAAPEPVSRLGLFPR